MVIAPCHGHPLFLRPCIECVRAAAQEDRELEEEVEAARRAVLEAAAQRRREEGELDDEDLLIGAPATGGARPGRSRHWHSRLAYSHPVNRLSAATFVVAAGLRETGMAVLYLASICSRGGFSLWSWVYYR